MAPSCNQIATTSSIKTLISQCLGRQPGASWLSYGGTGAFRGVNSSESTAPIYHVNPAFYAAILRLYYKNQYLAVLIERQAWTGRQVNRDGTDFGSILAAA
jgi:hypothetical protein